MSPEFVALFTSVLEQSPWAAAMVLMGWFYRKDMREQMETLVRLTEENSQALRQTSEVVRDATSIAKENKEVVTRLATVLEVIYKNGFMGKAS